MSHNRSYIISLAAAFQQLLYRAHRNQMNSPFIGRVRTILIVSHRYLIQLLAATVNDVVIISIIIAVSRPDVHHRRTIGISILGLAQFTWSRDRKEV